MSFVTDMHAISVSLLQQYGDAGILRHIIYGDYNPDLGERAETVTELGVYYVQENYTDQSQATQTSGTPGITKSGDLKITTATSDSSKIDRTAEFVLYNGDVCELLDVSPISTQSGVVIYEMQARIKA